MEEILEHPTRIRETLAAIPEAELVVARAIFHDLATAARKRRLDSVAVFEELVALVIEEGVRRQHAENVEVEELGRIFTLDQNI
ncbi:MAG: hypothetical protein WDO18_09760 [Acidobacteriota bacterium]